MMGVKNEASCKIVYSLYNCWIIIINSEFSMRFEQSQAIQEAAKAVIKLDSQVSPEEYQNTHEILFKALQLYWAENKNTQPISDTPHLVSTLKQLINSPTNNNTPSQPNFFYCHSQQKTLTPAKQFIQGLYILCGFIVEKSNYDLRFAYQVLQSSAATNYPAAQYAVSYLYKIAGESELARRYRETAKHNGYDPIGSIARAIEPARKASIISERLRLKANNRDTVTSKQVNHQLCRNPIYLAAIFSGRGSQPRCDEERKTSKRTVTLR